MNFNKVKKQINLRLRSVKKINKRSLIIASIIIALLAIGYLSKNLLVAAMVNGRPIMRIALIRELEKQGGTQTLDNLIVKTLIFQEAANKGLSISQEEIDSEISRYEEIIGQQGMSLDEALSLQGQSKNDLIEQIKIKKTVEKILADKLLVSDQEIKEYFDKNKDLYDKNTKFEDISSDIKNQLVQTKLETEYQAWITDLKSNSKINYFVNF